MRKSIFCLLPIVIAMAYGISAATISGTIYNMNLEQLDDVVVGINTEPMQKYVAKNGNYSFNLNPGKYTIIAFRGNGENLEIIQKIEIKEEGDYLLDLILFPTIKEEEELLNITGIDFYEGYFEEKSYAGYWIGGAAVLVIIYIILFMIFKPKKKREEKEEKKTEEHTKKEEKKTEDLADKVIDFIKQEGGRTTQKDIRKEFPSSEAKISLIISELEHKGRIEKIKKGRGNIIKLKED